MGDEDLKKCQACGAQCCRSVAIRLEEPEDEGEYIDFKWYIFHGMTVYLDKEGDWHVDVPAKCSKLGKDNSCKIYGDRPPVCREYDVKDCDADDDMVVHFQTPEDVDRYITKLKRQGRITKSGNVRK